MGNLVCVEEFSNNAAISICKDGNPKIAIVFST